MASEREVNESMKSTMKALSMCPFCGGEPDVNFYPALADKSKTLFSVVCEDCFASIEDFHSATEAIEAWNRRAS